VSRISASCQLSPQQKPRKSAAFPVSSPTACALRPRTRARAGWPYRTVVPVQDGGSLAGKESRLASSTASQHVELLSSQSPPLAGSRPPIFPGDGECPNSSNHPFFAAKAMALCASGNFSRTRVSGSAPPVHPIKGSMEGRDDGSNSRSQPPRPGPDWVTERVIREIRARGIHRSEAGNIPPGVNGGGGGTVLDECILRSPLGTSGQCRWGMPSSAWR
jgi:hypothetical protein